MASAANEEFRAPMGETLFAGYLANVLDVEVRARDATVLVADSRREVVGTITVYRDINEEGMPAAFPAGTAGIRATAVSPSVRGQGIGTELVNAAIDEGSFSGRDAIALHTASAWWPRCACTSAMASSACPSTTFARTTTSRGRRRDARSPGVRARTRRNALAATTNSRPKRRG